MSDELYKRLRPKNFKDMVGCEAAAQLNGMCRKESVPHSILFTGPSGTGKTTLARILRRKLGCEETDFHEYNCADVRGVDFIRTIGQRMRLAPKGDSKIYLIDECHQLTKDAMNAMLKMLEDTPKHVYFFLCTTDPDKLLKAIRTRTTPITCRALTVEEMEGLLDDTATKIKFDLKEEVRDTIVEVAEGSPRMALVLLNMITSISDTKNQLKVIHDNDSKRQIIELCRLLLNSKATWKQAATMLKELEGEEPETIRRTINGYARSVLLGGGKLIHRAALMIECFEDNVYDSGHPGIALRTYTFFHGDD